MGNSTYEKKVDALSEDLAELREAFKDLTADLKKINRDDGKTFIRDRWEGGKDRARDAYETMKDRGQDAYEAAREHGRAAAETVERQIEQRPVTSVLAAAGAGLLVGWLLLGRNG